MSIKIEQLNAMFEQQEIQKKSTKNTENTSFQAALAQELGLTLSDSPQKNQSLTPNSKINSIEQVFSTQSDIYSEQEADYENAVQDAIMQTSSALNTWDAYADELGKNGATPDLRGAYNHLQGLDSQINALRENSKNVLDQSPDLANIIEELDVMRVTETFKLNRGDYV